MKLGGSMRRRRNGVKWTVRYRRKARGLGGYLAAEFGTVEFLWKVGLFAAVGLGGGYLMATRVLFPAPPPPGDVTRVPDLRGQPLPEASGSLEALGLAVQVVDSFRHPTVTAGSVVGQGPLPGQLSRVGDTVRVSLSMGPEERPIPDVTRLRVDRAQTVLEATGFQVVLDSIESDVPRGRIVSMAPEAGTVSIIPQDIMLVFSTGPPMVEMPLLLGLEEEQALAIIDSLGLTIQDVETRFRFGRDQGLVVEQEPPAQTPLERGSAVRLVVGRRGR
jgi:serine/threonine-protein kinase